MNLFANLYQVPSVSFFLSHSKTFILLKCLIGKMQKCILRLNIKSLIFIGKFTCLNKDPMIIRSLSVVFFWALKRRNQISKIHCYAKYCCKETYGQVATEFQKSTVSTRVSAGKNLNFPWSSWTKCLSGVFLSYRTYVLNFSAQNLSPKAPISWMRIM